jgi:DMSO/TMAO reductase YedYZ molybdopterin-dependent catalytic subunit
VVRYEKYVRVVDAYAIGAFLAVRMNQHPVPVEHGGPLRLVIPGHYGTSWVKCVTDLALVAQPPRGRFMSELYLRPDSSDPMWPVDITSQITSPARGDCIPSGQVTTVSGLAWGRHDVAKVEVSTDGGTTWHPACTEPPAAGAWTRFTYTWHPAVPGHTRLLSRASDTAGNRQPAHNAINRVAGPRVAVT